MPAAKFIEFECNSTCRAIRRTGRWRTFKRPRRQCAPSPPERF